MKTLSLPQDYQARQAALEPGRSFAVSAPAGSGKTGLLTQRVLKLLSLCDNPEEVLAITFTRKAAGEMQDRILQALWKAKEQPKPDNPHDQLTWQLATQVLEHDERLQWNLLQCPQRLRVQTIDSLSSSISRQLPIANGFGATPAPTDNPEAAYRQAVHQLFSELEKESSLRDELSLLLRHLDNNIGALEKLLISLLAKRDQWLGAILMAQHTNARAYLEQVLQDIITETLAQAHQALHLHGSELALIADWAGLNLRESNPASPFVNFCGMTGLPKPACNELANWINVANFLLTNSGSFRKSLTKNEGFPAAKENKDSAAYKNRFAELVGNLLEAHPDIDQAIHQIRLLPPPTYSDSQWQLLDSLTRLLPRLAAQLNLVFAELGETDFTAISQAALTALGDDQSPSDVALQLDYRIRHILVDEFQDTSSTQLQLLEKLTAGWQSGDGRSLFIVGDGMQSCYSFRNANVGIFLEARKDGIGGLPLEPLDLTVNFRSQSGVVEWVNEHFQTAFPADDDIGRGAVRYSPSVAFKPRLDTTAVEIHISSYLPETESPNSIDERDEDSDTSGSKYLAELQENEAIAQLIVQLRRDYPKDTVALLARSRNHLQTIFPALSRRDLSWQATDIDSLAQRMAIIDLTSLTRALLNLGDRIAWLAILRAPWCGLDLKDLHRIANADIPLTEEGKEQNPKRKASDFPLLWQQVRLHSHISGLSSHARQALAKFVGIIEPAYLQRQRKPLRQWIEGIWLALGGPATLLDKQDINDLPNFFALLEAHEQGGNIKDWTAFNQAVGKLYAAPRENADSKLQVMTMHKSKGLEFDHVIIPRLHKTSPNDEQALLLWRERLNAQGERQLLLGSLAPTGGDKDPLYAYMKKEAALQLQYEATRLFYVGCTRAIKKLFLFGCLAQKTPKDGEEFSGFAAALKNPPSRSLLNCIWPKAQEQTQLVQHHATLTAASKSQFPRTGLQQLLRLASGWQAPSFVDESPLKKYRGQEYDDEENQPEPEIRSAKLARQTGTLIHRALQNLVGIADTLDLTQWQATQLPFWQIQLKQQGWHSDEIGQALSKINHAIRNTLSDARGQWLLDNRHPHSACELAIIHQQGNAIDVKLRENIIDRTFIADGLRWIIDYKSSEPASGQLLEDFILQEVATYKLQLARYKACFANLGETAIKTALYFPLLGGDKSFQEVDV
jgi:ATP-dependent helicase/nuclease subunit A